MQEPVASPNRVSIGSSPSHVLRERGERALPQSVVTECAVPLKSRMRAPRERSVGARVRWLSCALLNQQHSSSLHPSARWRATSRARVRSPGRLDTTKPTTLPKIATKFEGLASLPAKRAFRSLRQHRSCSPCITDASSGHPPRQQSLTMTTTTIVTLIITMREAACILHHSAPVSGLCCWRSDPAVIEYWPVD